MPHSQPRARTREVCFHCGDSCGDQPFLQDDRPFCCAGCRAVYSLLRERRLEGYYRAETAPGARPRELVTTDELAYLDDPSIVQQLTESATGSIARVTLTLPQIHCASCIWLLERLPQLEPAAHSAEVDFPRKQLSVIYDSAALSLRRLVERLTELGYAPVIRLDSAEADAANAGRLSHRQLHLQVGVAGFAFGNIMLFSFPEYLSGGAEITPEISQVFGYGSIALSLPVVGFAALDYFRSAWRGLRRRALNIDLPIALGVSVLFARSVYEILSGAGAGYLDSLAGLVFFLLLGRLFQEKTYATLSFERDYRSYFPLSARRRTPSGVTATPLDQLAPGDRVMVRNAELIPADGTLIDGVARIDYAFVTGESEPQPVAGGERVFAGGRQMGAAIEIELTRSVSQSYLTSLWSSGELKRREVDIPPTLITMTAKYFTPATLLIAVGAFALWLPVGVGAALNAATATLIVACPCALALTTPFALGAAMRALGRARLFVKNTNVIERLGAVTTIVFDKTGTLTRANTIATYHGAPLSQHQQIIIASLAEQSSHPASRAIADALSGPVRFAVTDFEEVVGAGVRGTVDTASVAIGSAAFVGAPSDANPADVYVAINGQPLGGFHLPATLRPGMRETVAHLQRDTELALLSGDTARQEPLMRELFGGGATLRFAQSPTEKLNFISARRVQGACVAMIGDGLNDAGALAAADVGIALSDDHAGFSPACDAVLAADTLPSLPRALRFARQTRTVIKIGITLSLLYNIVGLSYAVSGELTPLVAAALMPLSSITVVAFAAGATYGLASRAG
ncbi:MAG TPA: heavy metal translocating P-type ATPase metal-binding domain-containing protein, partial [candidate division Zixibacteria bacterium]|nr:heavy metal translocating P-type ATPase metal-binding domain-containing protein [candidate division Zixibacteria bacterium]